MTRDEKFRQAAWAYVAYGIVYWLGGLALVSAGLGPPVAPWLVAALFVAAAVLIVLIPWVLARERPWFDRWVLARRDFARVLTLWVALRAVEVGRIAWRPRHDLVSVGGFGIPTRLAAWVFFLMTVAMVILLARAGWSRDR